MNQYRSMVFLHPFLGYALIGLLFLCLRRNLEISGHKLNATGFERSRKLYPMWRTLNGIDLPAKLLVTLTIVVHWVFENLRNTEFGHRDEIALLPFRISPTTYGGRYFPLGHMEFNVLTLEGVGHRLAVLYLIPLIGLILCITGLFVLLRNLNLLSQLIAVALIYWACLRVSYANLIVPERNILLLVVLVLALISIPTDRQPFVGLVTCALLLNTSLYYKEPTVVLWLGYFLSYSLIQFVRFRRQVAGLDQLRRSLSLSGVALLASAWFAVGYLIFVSWANSGEASLYVNPTLSGAIPRALSINNGYPIFSMNALVLLTCVVFRRRSIPFEQVIPLVVGSTGYAMVVIIGGLDPNGYYYTPALLTSLIATVIVLDNVILRPHLLTRGSTRRFSGIRIPKLVAIAATLPLAFYGGRVVENQSELNRASMTEKREYQNEYRFLRQALSKRKSFDRVYYLPRSENYQDYSTAVLMIFLYVAGIDGDFEIVSPNGCFSKMKVLNKGQITCSELSEESILAKLASDPSSKLLVYERGTSYGERLEATIETLI